MLSNLLSGEIVSKIESKLEELLPNSNQELIIEAMRYSSLAGGKRIRPLLTVAGGGLSGASLENLIIIGSAIELIHCYSLIHDDLPAMDDDDLRRGRPTCHKKYNEAIAILAGDALQTQAFNILSSQDLNIADASKLKIINLVSYCAGAFGMVGGQAIDLISTGINLSLEQLKQMHLKKTGALIKASILSGYLSGDQYNENTYSHLDIVAENLGLLFQITDDILDVTADTATLGKTAQKDLVKNKATYVNILGLDKATSMAESLFLENIDILNKLPHSEQLIELAHFVYERSS